MTAPDAPDGDLVDVRVPADGAYISSLRLMAASLAARSDLTIDDIEDLRLAVDEACTLLLPHAAAGSQLHARFRVSPGTLVVDTEVESPDSSDATPDRDGFGWSVLSALASDVDVRGGSGRLTITVTKRREPATA